MSESTKRDSNGCAEVRELVPWYPTDTLALGERRRVEDHVSECEMCAGLLDFSAEVKEMMVAAEALHPSPEALVDFVEGAAAPADRETIESHVAACASCREQVDALERVDSSDIPVEQTVRGERPSPLARFWDSLQSGILGPVPAALYLVVAIVAAGLLLRSPGDGPNPGMGIAPASGVVIVPDDGDRVRQAVREDDRGVVLDASVSHLLLLELTRLASPPGGDDDYTVSVVSRDAGDAVLTTTVSGDEFEENYTIAFTLPAGTLGTGDYTVVVTDPSGETVFHSALTIRR